MRSLLSLIPYFKKYKKKLLLGFAFILFSIGANSLYPLVIGAAIDDLTTGSHRYSLITYALTGIGLIIFSGTFLFLIRQNIIVVSREIENDLRHDFFHIFSIYQDHFTIPALQEILWRMPLMISAMYGIL